MVQFLQDSLKMERTQYRMFWFLLELTVWFTVWHLGKFLSDPNCDDLHNSPSPFEEGPLEIEHTEGKG